MCWPTQATACCKRVRVSSDDADDSADVADLLPVGKRALPVGKRARLDGAAAFNDCDDNNSDDDGDEDDSDASSHLSGGSRPWPASAAPAEQPLLGQQGLAALEEGLLARVLDSADAMLAGGLRALERAGAAADAELALRDADAALAAAVTQLAAARHLAARHLARKHWQAAAAAAAAADEDLCDTAESS